MRGQNRRNLFDYLVAYDGTRRLLVPTPGDSLSYCPICEGTKVGEREREAKRERESERKPERVRESERKRESEKEKSKEEKR